MVNSSLVLLLSSTYPKKCHLLQQRRRLAHALENEGLKTIIMEDYKFNRTLARQPIFKRFMHILDQKIDLIPVIIPKDASMHAVVFELALILVKYGDKKFLKRVRFFVEIGTDINTELPLYVKEYFRKIRCLNYSNWRDIKELILYELVD